MIIYYKLIYIYFLQTYKCHIRYRQNHVGLYAIPNSFLFNKYNNQILYFSVMQPKCLVAILGPLNLNGFSSINYFAIQLTDKYKHINIVDGLHTQFRMSTLWDVYFWKVHDTHFHFKGLLN